MKYETLFRGTPKDLALKIDDIQDSNRKIVPVPNFWYIPGGFGFELQNDANPVEICLDIDDKKVFISVRRLPDGFSKMTLEIDDEIAPVCKIYWDLLCKELEKEKWLIAPDDLAVVVPNKKVTTDIRIPSRQATRKRWEVIWKKVKGQWQSEPNYARICLWLQKTSPDISVTSATLAKIIKAGEAGLLDEGR